MLYSVFDPNGEVQAARLTFFGLYTLQHRGTFCHHHSTSLLLSDASRGCTKGQEGCGLASNDGSSAFHVHKGMGLVTQVSLLLRQSYAGLDILALRSGLQGEEDQTAERQQQHWT